MLYTRIFNFGIGLASLSHVCKNLKARMRMLNPGVSLYIAIWWAWLSYKFQRSSVSTIAFFLTMWTRSHHVT